MSFSIGIVGLPNVGKSTLFKALTKKQVDISNYPFCTIAPNVGVVSVPDERLEKLAVFSKSEKIIPTAIEFVDIAGLVRGAHQGEGLGNQFLAHIREVDAIAQVIRVFEDENIVHVDGNFSPAKDLETIDLELVFADLAAVEKRMQAAEKAAKAGIDKQSKQLMEILAKIKKALDEGQAARTVRLSKDEEILINKEMNLLTRKPVLYVLNTGEKQPSVKEEELIGKFNLPVRPEEVIVISAKLEAEISDLPEEERKDYGKELGLEASGLDKLIIKGYKLLDLITFFATGPKETHAWTIAAGSKAPQAAGKIHTDFEKGFIRAEIINWQDLISSGSEAGAREKGLLRIEGKEYIMRDGDVVHFRFSV